MGIDMSSKIFYFVVILAIVCISIYSITKLVIIYILCVKYGKVPCMSSKVEVDVKNAKASSETAITYIESEKCKEKNQSQPQL